MRYLLSALFVLSVAGCAIEGTSRNPFEPEETAAPYLPELEAGAQRLVILHTNDEHSHLLGFGPNSEYPYLPALDGTGAVDEAQTLANIQAKLTTGDTETVGGIVRRQYLINRERARAAENGDSVLLLSAGDVMMGTMFHATYTAGQAPDYLMMNFLGYDFIALGNHEFDFGPDLLAGAIRSGHQLTFGGQAPLLAANIGFEDVVAGGSGSALKAMYDDGDSGAPIMPWATKLLANGLRVGVFGLVGYDAAFVAPNKSPIAFSRPDDGAPCVNDSACGAGLSCVRRRCVSALDLDGHLEALAGDAQVAIDALRAEGVDMVIALSHSGMAEDSYLAANTDGIDVIVGGHSHQEIAPTEINGTVIVQAGNYGRKLGKLVLVIDADGAITVDNQQSELIPVDGSVDNALRLEPKAVETAVGLTAGVIGSLVVGLNDALLEALVQDVLGVTASSILEPLDIVTSDHDIIGDLPHQESYLTHLVTDAVLQQVWDKKSFLPSRPMVAIQANGVVRETLRFGNSNQKTTLADVFRTLPLGGSPWEGDAAAPGYPILLFTLTPAELMVGLEIGVTQGLVADSFFLTSSGMWVEYDRNRPDLVPGNWDTGHVVKIEIEEEPFGNIYTLYEAGVTNPWKDAGGSPIDPTDASERIMILTNLYIGGFLDTYGLSPRDEDGNVIGDPANDPLLERLSHTALCMQPVVPLFDLVYCETLDLGGPPWDLLPELKGWEATLMYLSELGSMGALYSGTTVSPVDKRVIDVTN